MDAFPHETLILCFLSMPLIVKTQPSTDIKIYLLVPQYVVKVSSAEWEPEERLWKYRVVIQKRIVLQKKERLNELTNGYTSRSLTDFGWLEQSLMKEYHGGLLLPSLAITLGVPDLENTQHEVDSQLLTNWLSDVLNGVRGQGKAVVEFLPLDFLRGFLCANSHPSKYFCNENR